jgi:hypothetical protein
VISPLTVPADAALDPARAARAGKMEPNASRHGQLPGTAARCSLGSLAKADCCLKNVQTTKEACNLHIIQPRFFIDCNTDIALR